MGKMFIMGKDKILPLDLNFILK